MAEIQVAVQDGESKAFPQGVTVAEALKGLVSGKQRKQTVAVQCCWPIAGPVDPA